MVIAARKKHIPINNCLFHVHQSNNMLIPIMNVGRTIENNLKESNPKEIADSVANTAIEHAQLSQFTLWDPFWWDCKPYPQNHW